MKPSVLSVAIRLVFLSVPGPLQAGGMEGGGLGFGYCPPPVIPSCIERSAASRNRRDLDACSRDVLRFTQTLGTYRGCLTRESERAIGTGNDAIARFRCLAQRGGACRTKTGATPATER